MKDLVWGIAEETDDPTLAKILNLDYLMREYPGQPPEMWDEMPAGEVDLLIELGRTRSRLGEVKKMMER